MSLAALASALDESRRPVEAAHLPFRLDYDLDLDTELDLGRVIDLVVPDEVLKHADGSSLATWAL